MSTWTTILRILCAFLLLFSGVAACGGGDDPEGAAPRTGREEESGEGHGDPWFVELDEQQVRETGIDVVRAGPARLEERLVATAMVADNLDAQAHVTPILPGIVRSVDVHLGHSVAAGEAMAVVESVELGRAVSRLLEAEAELGAAERSLERERELLDRSVAVARTIFERERRLADEEIATLRPFYEAERALRTAELERDRRLLALEADVTRRRIRRDAARRALEVLGIDPDLIADEERSRDMRTGRYRIRAPIAGVVVARDITLNEAVDREDVVYRIQDLSRIWVEAAVFEKDVTKVRVGASARVRLDAFPGETFEGEVTFVAYRVDRESRALPVRVEIENRGVEGWGEPWPVRPGMFGRAEIAVGLRRAEVVVPEGALVHERDGDRVFVRVGPHAFQGRRVRTGADAAGLVEILSGVRAGEEVVASGTFLLKSIAHAEEIGEGHGD